MHKDELLEYKDVIQDRFSESTARDRAAGGGRKSTRGSRIVQLPVSQVQCWTCFQDLRGSLVLDD